MSAPYFQLQSGQTIVGQVDFLRPPALTGYRTWDGLAFTLPTRVSIDGPKDDSMATLANLGATVVFKGVEVGVAHDAGLYASPEDREGSLVLRLRADIVRAIDRARNGLPLEFDLDIFGHLQVLHRTGLQRPSDQRRGPHHPKVRVNYDAHAWTNLLMSTGLGDNVVVEIALPPKPGGPWDSIWDGLQRAREHLLRGGEGAWKGAIMEARQALDEWRQHEAPDQGPGWTRPPTPDLETRTREQRYDNLRWHLLQCAHDAAHSGSHTWRREDAVAVVATLASLLAIRNP